MLTLFVVLAIAACHSIASLFVPSSIVLATPFLFIFAYVVANAAGYRR